MPHVPEDLYTSHQTLTALVNVLVHDLRNPLHSATLVVEAMGSPSADVSSLRTKLRGQVGKLDGLIGQAAAAMRELALDPQIEAVDLDALLGSLGERYRTVIDEAVSFRLPTPSGVAITVDRRLVEKAILEIAAVLAEHGRPSSGGEPLEVTLSIDEPETGTVRLWIGDLDRAYADTLAKAPFAIAGGGIRLAVARALTQNAGGTLRLTEGADGVSRFALSLHRANGT
jgi:signal transduction histidine kinase